MALMSVSSWWGWRHEFSLLQELLAGDPEAAPRAPGPLALPSSSLTPLHPAAWSCRTLMSPPSCPKSAALQQKWRRAPQVIPRAQLSIRPWGWDTTLSSPLSLQQMTIPRSCWAGSSLRCCWRSQKAARWRRKSCLLVPCIQRCLMLSRSPPCAWHCQFPAQPRGWPRQPWRMVSGAQRDWRGIGGHL